MDSVVIGLSVAVAIVVILLLSCWNKKAVHPSRRARPSTQSTKYSVDKSDTGSGVDNVKSQARYNDLANLASYDDYSTVAQYMAVEPEVYESHARYSQDMGRSTSGPSMLPVRDDPNDVVPWVGLRKPKYQDVYSQPGARQEHSEIPDQMRSNSFYCIG